MIGYNFSYVQVRDKWSVYSFHFSSREGRKQNIDKEHHRLSYVSFENKDLHFSTR